MAAYPLEGLLVADFSQVVSGPFCSMLLGDLGATVIKIERPEGEENRRVRRFAGRAEQDEDFFYAVNRSKRSVVADLRQADDRARVYALCCQADVVLENFAPGVMERWGLGYQHIVAQNPTIVYCSISGFGAASPYRERRAYDSTIQAFTGVMEVTGEPKGPPQRAGLLVADVTAALYAFGAILVALYARARTGRGTWIDLAMADALLSSWATVAAEFLATARLPRRTGMRSRLRSPAGTFRCADGRYVEIMAGSPRLWPLFCQAVGAPEWTEDARFATMESRLNHQPELDEMLERIFAQRSAAEWEAVLTQQGVPASRVNTLAEALASDHAKAREMLLALEHPTSGRIQTINHPFRFSNWESRPRRAPPQLGADTAEILNAFGQRD